MAFALDLHVCWHPDMEQGRVDPVLLEEVVQPFDGVDPVLLEAVVQSLDGAPHERPPLVRRLEVWAVLVVPVCVLD